jgi:hypothetical protein
LTKPDGTDLVDVAVLNTNFDKIDSNIASTKIQATKPTTANAGDLWWDSNTGTLYLYYTDANSSQWVAATSDPVNIGVVANQSERDAQYPTPGQGMRVYRTDLGVTQTYYGLFNASTNPGGRDVAGWYNTEKSVGLVPIQPSTVTAATGSATANSLGVISFSSASAVSLNGVFSSEYKNYSIIFDYTASSIHAFRMRLRSATNDSTTSYYQAGRFSNVLGGSGDASVNNLSFFELGSSDANALNLSGGKIELRNVFRNFWTQGHQDFTGVVAAQIANLSSNLIHAINTQYDGFTIYPSSGNITGTIQVFGYNDK